MLRRSSRLQTRAGGTFPKAQTDGTQPEKCADSAAPKSVASFVGLNTRANSTLWTSRPNTFARSARSGTATEQPGVSARQARSGRPKARIPAALLAGVALVTLSLSGCSASAQAEQQGKIVAIGAENQYADLISQLGGDHVYVSAVMSNPNTDPHSFEASPKIAQDISRAQLVVQNGLGYDDFMTQIESATSGGGRTVIVAQKVLGLPDSTTNPHLWYDVSAMKKVASAIAKELGELQPENTDYFTGRLATVTASLDALANSLKQFKAQHSDASAATTEPVADYLLSAAGIRNKTPWALQASVMNGTDPAPQNVATQKRLLKNHQVQVFVYNRQITDATTEGYLGDAEAGGVPVVGVDETMPPGDSYQGWIQAEFGALQQAIEHGISTENPQ